MEPIPREGVSYHSIIHLPVLWAYIHAQKKAECERIKAELLAANQERRSFAAAVASTGVPMERILQNMAHEGENIIPPVAAPQVAAGAASASAVATSNAMEALASMFIAAQGKGKDGAVLRGSSTSVDVLSTDSWPEKLRSGEATGDSILFAVGSKHGFPKTDTETEVFNKLAKAIHLAIETDFRQITCDGMHNALVEYRVVINPSTSHQRFKIMASLAADRNDDMGKGILAAAKAISSKTNANNGAKKGGFPRRQGGGAGGTKNAGGRACNACGSFYHLVAQCPSKNAGGSQ